MSKSHSIIGTYKITHMDQWDQDFVDAEVPGFIRFDHGGAGEFHFGYVQGQMVVEFTERSGKAAAEWSWVGNDEMHEASGRGWAVLESNGHLKGKLFFHGGDSSGFTAEKTGTGRTTKSARTAQAIDATSGKPVEVDLENIRPGRTRNDDLSESLLIRLRAVYEALPGLMVKTLEEFELSFMRDIDPEGEVALWERIVLAMDRVCRAMPKLDRKLVLRTLLGYSMDALSEAEKGDPVVRKIISTAEGK